LSTTVATGSVTVRVNDTGHGIKKEIENKMFEPFQSATPRGMGIGLSLCRSIVQAHMGRIWVEPSKTGATFAFSLPLPGHTHDQDA